MLLSGLRGRGQVVFGRFTFQSGGWRVDVLWGDRDGEFEKCRRGGLIVDRLSSAQAGIITLKCDIIKGGVEKFALKQPIFVPGPVSRRGVCSV